MNRLTPCVKCGSKQLFTIDEALIPNYEYANSVVPLTLTAAYTESGKTNWLGAIRERPSVRIEAKICAECAYTELYAKDLEVLARFASNRLGNVRRVKVE